MKLHLGRNNKRALSLTELLVVLSIVTILSGFAMSVVLQSSQRARKLKCRNNLTQLATAFHQFSLNHNGKMPKLEKDEEAWMAALSAYLSTPSVFVCPDDIALVGSATGKAANDSSHPGMGVRSASYECLLHFRRVTFDGGYVWHSLAWEDVFKRRGGETPLLQCPFHRDGILLVRVNGGVTSYPRLGKWDVQ